MANKKINELSSRTPSLTDLVIVGDPSSGYSYKATITALATIIETDIADGYVTIGTTQTISGAKTFSNNITATSVSNANTDTDKFLVLNASNVINFRTGAELLSDIGGQGALTLTTTGTSGAATLVGNTLNIPQYADQYVGTVTSVAMSVPTGLSVSGSPITTSGTLAVTFTAGYSIPTTSSQSNWDTAYTNRITSLTTTGSSGAATLVSNTLNIPNYTLAGLGGISGTGTTNYIPKFTSSSAIGNSVIYESSSKIGIGTTSPNAILEVANGAIRTSYLPSGNAFLELYSGGSAGYVEMKNNNPLAFIINGSEQMRLTSTGLGIGTSSPAYKLDVSGDARVGNTASSNPALINFSNSINGFQFGFNSTTTQRFVWNNGAPTEIMTLTGTGSLGIGTSSPAYKLDVNGLISSYGQAELLRLRNNDAYISFYNSANSTRQAYIQAQTTALTLSADGANAFMVFATGGGAERMRITSGGNVGIGTTSPGSLLDVVAGTAYDGVIRVRSTSTNTPIVAMGVDAVASPDGYVGTQNSVPFGIRTNDVNRIWITTAGNVGIGSTAPEAKLQVSGGSLDGSSLYDLGISSALTNGRTGTFQSGTLASLNTRGDASSVEISAGVSAGYYTGISATANNASTYAGTLRFVTAGSERMRITSAGNVGIGSSSPTSLLHVAGSLRLPHVTKSATYTLDATDYTVGFDCSSNRTANLPDATTCAGRIYVIYQYNTNNGTTGVTLDGNGSQTINGSTTYGLTGYCDYSSIMIQSDGSNWIIISDAITTGCL